MSKSAKIGLSVALLVAAAVLYFLRSGGGASEINAWKEYETRMRCRACSADFVAELRVDELPPVECPKCHKRDAWRLWRCNQCGTEFVPDPVGDPPRAPVAPSCPKCRSSSTGAASTSP